MFRSVVRSGMLSLRKNQLNRELAGGQQGKSVAFIVCRQINTTDKQKDSHLNHDIEVYDPKWINSKKPKGPKTAEEFADHESQKNWYSYGFNFVDKSEDRLYFHMAMFTFVTCGCILFTYGLAYFPDYDLGDWVLREGFLELDRREKAGLPLISRDLIDPAKLELPSDEELGEYEVYL